jgi:tetratricopeptide (TPR) repeat protein
LDALKAHFLKALEADPDFPDAHFELGIIYFESNELKDAVSHFQSAIEGHSSEAKRLVKRGEELLKKSQFQHAKDQFLKSQQQKDSCASAWYHLSKVFNKRGKIDKAVESLENSIENNATTNAHRDLGILLLKVNKPDDARFHLEKAIGLDYGDSLTHFYLGIALERDKDTAEAEQHYLAALDINPMFTDCLINLAKLQHSLGKSEEANATLSKARNLDQKRVDKELKKLPI